MFSKKLLLFAFIISGKIMAPDTPRSIAESDSSRYSAVPTGTVDVELFKIADTTQLEADILVRENTGHTQISLHTVPALLKPEESPISDQTPKKSPKRSTNLLCCLKPEAQTESDPPTPKNVSSAFKEAAESIAKAAADSPAVVSAAVEGGKSIAKAAVRPAT